MEFKPLNKLFRPWLNDQKSFNYTISSCFKCLNVTNREYLPFIYNTNECLNFYVPFISKNELSQNSWSPTQPLHLSSYDSFPNNNSLNSFMKPKNQISSYMSPAIQSNLSSIKQSNDSKTCAINNSNWFNKFKRQRPKRFNCPHCQISFSNNGQLKGHIRTHTGERPFVCNHPDCGKSFTRNEELTRHRRIHTGIRPYSCIVCNKRFGRKDHLKKHQRTHEKRFYSIASNSMTSGSIPNANGMSFFNSMMLFQMRH